MTAEVKMVFFDERTCDGCARFRPVAAVIDDANICAECVLDSVKVLHSKRVGTNDYMAPYTYDYCVECRQVWPCETAKAIGLAKDKPSIATSGL